MFHIIKYRFLTMIKNKTLLFWTLAFPIGLATLFYVAFSNLGSVDTLNIIPVAIVDEGNENFNEVISELSKTGDSQLLDVTYTTKEKGNLMLEEGDVEAVLISSETPSILYKNDTLETQILKEVTISYLRINETIQTLALVGKQIINEEIIADVVGSKVVIREIETNGSKMDATMQYFYTIIAMATMYGAFWGLKSMNDIQANQSAIAMRSNIVPTHKLVLVAVDYLVMFVLMAIELSIIFAYLILVLQADFGHYFMEVIGISLCGLLMSLGLGIMIGCMSKLKLNANIGILNMITLTSNFLAGMMSSELPYILNKTVPFLKYINPASLIVNGFNILYYYEDITPVYTNMGILVLMGAVFILISYQALRRKTYASI